MRLLIVLFIGLLSSISFGQEWRDSLTVARKAYKSGEYSKALKYYESAQKKAPENIDLSDEMGQSAYKAREFEKAEKIYQQNSNNKKTSKSKAANYHNLGNSRMKSKNYQGAVDAYKDALRNNPSDERTRYNLSEAIRKLKEQEKKEQQQDQNQDKDQNNQKDKQDQQSQNDKQDQKGQKEKKDQQGEQKKNGQKNQQKSGDKSGQGDQKQGQLPNKTVDKMLDDLMKREAETKRRMTGNGGGGKTPKSGKDW